jgi:hypothetical protein
LSACTRIIIIYFSIVCFFFQGYYLTDTIILHAAVATIGAGIGIVLSVAVVAVGDLLIGKVSGFEDYAGGAVLATTGNAYLADALGGAAGDAKKQGIEILSGKRDDFSTTELALSTVVGGATGAIPDRKISGVTSGKGSMTAVAKQIDTKLQKDIISNVSTKTASKIAVGRSVKGVLSALDANNRNSACRRYVFAAN